MRKVLIYLVMAAVLASGSSALDLSGNNNAGFWLSQPGYALAYREAIDLTAKGKLERGYRLTLGLRYLQDQEIWDDSTTSDGISKRYLELENGTVDLRVGNYYATLGRGLVLNCIEDRRIKIDRELDGGYLRLDAGKGVQLKGIAGKAFENSVRLDNRSYAGGEIRYEPLDLANLGGLYLRANASGDPGDPNYNSLAEESYGGYAGMVLGSADLYGEYIQRHTYGMQDPTLGWIGTDDAAGKGFYASGSWTSSGFGLFLDYKDYKALNGSVNAPPACNRDGRLLNMGADEQGGQADVTLSLIPSLELNGNYSRAWSDKGGAKWDDLFFQGKWSYDQSWTLLGEGRFRIEDSLETEVVRRKYHGAGIGIKWTSKENRQALDGRLDVDEYANIYFTGPLWFRVTRVELTWVVWRNASLYFGWEYSDHRLPEYDNQQKWGRAGLTLNLGQDQKLDISAGQYKGGLVCSGGFCRYEPPFKGIKTSWLWSF